MKEKHRCQMCLHCEAEDRFYFFVTFLVGVFFGFFVTACLIGIWK